MGTYDLKHPQLQRICIHYPIIRASKPTSDNNMKWFHLFSVTVIWAFAITHWAAGDYQERQRGDDRIEEKTKCYKRGDTVDDEIRDVNKGGKMYLASFCMVKVTLNPRIYFPSHFNEEVCDDKDHRGCLYNEGVAVQKVMYLTFQRRNELDEMEDYTQTIRTGCECMVDEHSVLTAYIKY